MYFIIALPVFFIICGFIIGLFISAPVYKGPKSLGFNGRQFTNYDDVKAKGFLDVLKWAVNREKGHWSPIADEQPTAPNKVEDSITIYYVNHSTFLVQWKGLNILTDPIWSERTSPFSFAGPKRMRPPGIAFDKLPKIDLVVLSHNHYDHLDLPTLKRLKAKNSDIHFIVPAGVELYLGLKGFKNITSLHWWEQTQVGQLNVEMVPAQHFSGRGILDRDKTLWGGYMIKAENMKLYFAGDTGYNQRMFDDISKKHKKIDVALIPIGAYKPHWFMSPIHISPEEAVKVHQQLNIKKSIAMHFGTFPLADDGQKDPELDLNAALEKNGIPKDNFILPKEGIRI